ncbi:MAG TPA: hypothetical protein VKY92_28115 [Verrucomicrobiae bacterium]|nr:hypothetical protein [Verrucomicrobiae bacterium]
MNSQLLQALLDVCSAAAVDFGIVNHPQIVFAISYGPVACGVLRQVANCLKKIVTRGW